MIFLFGEKTRSREQHLGELPCAVCGEEQPFTEQEESNWFCLFAIPLLPIERIASYRRCECCLSAYSVSDLSVPAAVPIVKRIVLYLLAGYNQHAHVKLGQEICLKLTNFELSDDEARSLMSELESGRGDIVDGVRQAAPTMNAIAKQQVIEAAFLATYACCDLQYEDRLRINLIGNAMGVGLEFVDYVIDQTRKQSYYGIRRLRIAESEV